MDELGATRLRDDAAQVADERGEGGIGEKLDGARTRELTGCSRMTRPGRPLIT
jgi:hypothetical protein